MEVEVEVEVVQREELRTSVGRVEDLIGPQVYCGVSR